MTFAYQILIHTPPWVWILLAYLVWQGIKAMQPRTVPIWRALIVPVRIMRGRWSPGSWQHWCCCPLAC